MADSVAAMLLLALVLAVMTVMGRATIVSNSLMERTSREALERADQRAKTNFSIESITANGTAIRLVLKNTGSTSATDFAHMDFIADYVGGGSAISKRLT